MTSICYSDAQHLFLIIMTESSAHQKFHIDDVNSKPQFSPTMVFQEPGEQRRVLFVETSKVNSYGFELKTVNTSKPSNSPVETRSSWAISPYISTTFRPNSEDSNYFSSPDSRLDDYTPCHCEQSTCPPLMIFLLGRRIIRVFLFTMIFLRPCNYFLQIIFFTDFPMPPSPSPASVDRSSPDLASPYYDE